MKFPLPCRTAGGPVRVIGAAFAAVMLTALALPVAASNLSAQGNDPYEGHDLNITFTNTSPQRIHFRYRYKTADGSATGSGRWQDYEPTSGWVQWSPGAANAQEAVTVKTVQDQLCEHDETVKVRLTNLQRGLQQSANSPIVWFIISECNSRGFACEFEVEAKIKQHADGCAAGTFGE